MDNKHVEIIKNLIKPYLREILNTWSGTTVQHGYK